MPKPLRGRHTTKIKIPLNPTPNGITGMFHFKKGGIGTVICVIFITTNITSLTGLDPFRAASIGVSQALDRRMPGSSLT